MQTQTTASMSSSAANIPATWLGARRGPPHTQLGNRCPLPAPGRKARVPAGRQSMVVRAEKVGWWLLSQITTMC